MDKFDIIGVNYNEYRKADQYILDRVIDLLKANKYDRYLEIGSGTGNYTIALSEKGYNMTGLDPSLIMAGNAIENDKNKNVVWAKGYAEDLPFHDGLFSGVLCIHTIHHFKNIAKSFSEMYRVMSKGRVVLFTNSHEQLEKYWLKHYFPEVIYKSKIRTPDITLIEKLMKNIGFNYIGVEIFNIPDDFSDGFLGSHKKNPSMYLDPNFRKGMSIFWEITEKEIREGCRRLEEDILSGKFNDVISQFENDIKNVGEYLFIICEKE